MKNLPRWALPVFAAFAVNFLLLASAVLLTRENRVAQDMTAPTGVKLITLAAPEPPKQEELKAPEPPREEPKPDLGPDLFTPDLGGEFGGLGGVGGVAIDLGGANTGGMNNNFVFESYELDQAPRPVVKTPPVYPFKAREQGVEGVVQVKILVSADGSVGDVQIMDARPPDTFNDAVLKAVPHWRFEPGVIGGKRVTSWVVTALRFQLN
ncbi:MAG TPA: energy transducer TonB [Candidatus Krumholzibacteria bacterium]|nr:energy transducer TonB [Candidatus Krumholzibacteria bacterium]